MNIAIRVDASLQIGTGHFMRCLTLADSLKRNDAAIMFLSRHMPDHLRGMLRDKGHGFALLESVAEDEGSENLAHSHWLGTSLAADAHDSVTALSGKTWDWLIVDHYALDANWESRLRQSVKKIMVIDDLADRGHDCDLLLDQNLYENMGVRYDGKVPTNCRLLLGPRYALLRDEFRQMREHVKPRTGPVGRILVFFGGMDADNYTSMAITALVNLDCRNIHVDVVIGSQHPDREGIEKACSEYGFTCHVQTSRMAELMAKADLAIGAGGTATWERCSVGLPTIVLIIAENQREAMDVLHANGIVVNLDNAKDISVGELAHQIKVLVGDEKKRHGLSRRSLELMGMAEDEVADIFFNNQYA